MFANSKGQNLLDHSKAVACVAREIACVCGYDDRLQRIAYSAGLLHDIGKATKSFQDYIATGRTEEESISPLHHEISWAFLVNNYGIASNDHELMFNAIYWHHARPLNDKYEYLKTRDEITDKIKETDSKRIARLIKAFQSPEKGIIRNTGEEVPPLFYRETNHENINAEMLAVRMCLVSADRLVSGMSAEEVTAIAQGTSLPRTFLFEAERVKVDTIQCPALYEPERFSVQLNCAQEARKYRTTIVKAPAGFGKTMIGVLYALHQGKQSYWVCPRNVVAEAVYENIVREVRALNIERTVELFLTGERKKTNIDEGLIPEFCSDIVVTNIDNLLGPMVNNRVAGRLFNVLSGMVILDEFHEFVSDSPLFAVFITYMRARHRLSSTVNTLLLSATPLNVHELWDLTDRPTGFLPGRNDHYPAAHDGLYRTSFIDACPRDVQPASLCVFNSISMAQYQYENGHFDHLAHSKFIDADRHEIMKGIYAAFGKEGAGVKNGERVSAAPVIQAAMDISFVNLYESVCSPETTLQRIGRCNRWGNYGDKNPGIFLYIPDLKSHANERGAIETVYKRDLRDLWVRHLREKINDSQLLSLRDWYEIYNSFYADYGREIWGFLREQYKTGLLELIEYYPVKLLNGQGDKNRAGKSLRSPTGSYYFTVKIAGKKNEWLKPEDVMEEGTELFNRFLRNGELNAALINSSRMLPIVKALYECGYQSFRRMWKKSSPPRNIQHWFRLARDPQTPIPDFSRVYNKKLGLRQNKKEETC